MILMISFTIRGQGHDNAYKTQYLFVYLQLLTIIRNYIFEIFTNAVKAMHMFTKRNYCLFVYIQLLTDPPNLPRRTPFSLDVDDINDDDVKDILKSLQIGKASGGDFISHQMLKKYCSHCVLTLEIYF